MQYRRFGKLDFKVSALGFGCMRLPVIGGDRSKIDEPEATRMLRYAIDQGVNYVDTAFSYHGGNSQHFLGRALKDGYRQRIKLATKLPPGRVKEPEDFDRLLNEQLHILQTDQIDFYLLHGLRKDHWPKLRDFDVLPWLDRVRADGRVAHVGFSFHDNYELFKEIVDAYDRWDMCQIQYNFMNEEIQAGTRGLKYAAEKGLAVVVMEPLLGGVLAAPPEQIRKLWTAGPGKRTPADGALQWLWDKTEVSVVLSGMTAMQQVVENLESARRSSVHQLTEHDRALIDKIRTAYQTFQPIPCTSCGYCLPCPSGVDIPLNFQIYNNGVQFTQMGRARKNYIRHIPEQARAAHCVECRECEDNCPQEIKISEWMPRVHGELSEEG